MKFGHHLEIMESHSEIKIRNETDKITHQIMYSMGDDLLAILRLRVHTIQARKKVKLTPFTFWRKIANFVQRSLDQARDVPDTTLPDTGFNRIVIYRIPDIPDNETLLIYLFIYLFICLFVCIGSCTFVQSFQQILSMIVVRATFRSPFQNAQEMLQCSTPCFYG